MLLCRPNMQRTTIMLQRLITTVHRAPLSAQRLSVLSTLSCNPSYSQRRIFQSTPLGLKARHEKEHNYRRSVGGNENGGQLKTKAIARNRRIIHLGTQEDWRGILNLHDREKQDLDAINFATMISQLGRIQSFDETDPQFETFLVCLLAELKGNKADWMGVREQANVVHALGKRRMDSENAKNLCKRIFREDDVPYLVGKGNSQSIANLVWGCARTHFDAPTFFLAVERNLSTLLLDKLATPQTLSNIVCAFAAFKYRSTTLLKIIDQRADWLVENGNTQDISNVALSLAIWGYPSKPFFQSLSSHMAYFVETTTPQGMCNVCYSFAILGIAPHHETAFRLLWSKATELGDDDYTFENKRQLIQTYMLVSRPDFRLDPPMQMRGWMNDLSLPNSDSDSEQQVSRVLRQLGFQHELETSPFPGQRFVPGLLAIDMSNTNERIAIEFDGPTHYLRNIATGEVLDVENGPTKAKRGFLERVGWQVINIRYWDWDEATATKTEVAFLSGLLREAGYPGRY